MTTPEFKSQETIQYKTYLKRTVVEALRMAFEDHPNPLVRRASGNVNVEYPNERVDYPAVVVKFYERDIINAGLGHQEVLPVDDEAVPVLMHKYMHFLYHGSIEFVILGLTSADRDWLSDAFVEAVTMGTLQSYTARFFQRIYFPDTDEVIYSKNHFVNLNTDRLQGMGETQNIAPWQPEDVLVYQTSYRIDVFGEFYSPTPDSDPHGFVTQVDFFPYIKDLESVPDPSPGDPGIWTPLDPFDPYAH